MAHQFAPNLVAVNTILPYRCVAPTGSGDNACGAAGAINISMGVTSGDTKAHDSANHAEEGDQVSLQPGNVLQVECGGTVTRGTGLMTMAGGKVQNATATGATNIYHVGIALETGTDGTIVRMLWQPQTIRPALS